MIPRRQQRGSAMVEFVLTGIPMIFIWISIVQLSLGMWHYHTLQYAVKSAGAYTSHKGGGYVSAGNTAKTIAHAATVLKDAAIGMPASSIQVTWTSGATSVTCQLSNCLTNSTTWPPTANNAAGSQFTIRANYVFRSAIAMFAPRPGGTPMSFGAHNFPGYTRQMVVF